jgi:hypothetical protein
MDYRVRKVNGRWVAWDPYWRPIDAIEWTGTEWILKDETYSKDPTDYMCETLSDPTDADVCPDWIGTPEWFFDRPVVLSPCAPRTLESWKRMGLRRRTFRVRSGRKTFTKRTWK